jgi:glycogen synthase
MTTDTVGGVWNFSLELAHALCAKDVEVVLAALGGAATECQRNEAAQVPNARLLESPFKLEWMEDPWADIEKSGIWLQGIEEEYSPDIVHLNSYGHTWVPWQAPVALTAHSCVVSWWQAVKGGSPPAEWNRYHRLVHMALRTADCVAVPSEALRDSLANIYGLDPSLFEVIHNGRIPEHFYSRVKEPFVLVAGRLWDEGKNVAAVISVASELGCPIYLAGDDVCSYDGRSLPSNCRLLGKLSSTELADWYARAAVYAAPARYEPFGLSILEAALSHCALVLGDIPTLRELWDGAAEFVSPHDGAALRTVISRFLTNMEVRQTMADYAYRRAITYTPDQMAEEYMEFYQHAVTWRNACAS